MKILLLAFVLLLSPPLLAGPINVNTADVQTLDRELPGIGPALAKRIVDYRERHGPFRRPEDLQKVPYVGIKTFERLRRFVRVEDS